MRLRIRCGARCLFEMFYFLIAFNIAVLRVIYIDARVYCKDEFSTPFTTTGFSCPLKCENIVAAVERLKQMDYKMLIRDTQLTHKGKLKKDKSEGHHIDFLRGRNTNGTTNDSHAKVSRRAFEEYVKILSNDTILFYIKKDLYYMSIFEKIYRSNRSCFELMKFNLPEVLQQELIRKCTMRSGYEDDFVRRMTRILNMYSLADYQFTKEMTYLLLRKILGSNMDLRQGQLIVPKIISYLRKALAVESHQITRQRKAVIHLGSRHCLTIHVPGCYCKKGYIEKSGSCVLPQDCLLGVYDDMGSYLTRVIIN